MAKLIALALAFAALVAFASAHTIITTTIEEENYPDSRQQCSRQIQGERLNQCQRYLQQGQQQGNVQSCCQELQNVDQQCQCEAVKEAFRHAQMQQQQQQGHQQGESFGSQQLRQMRQKAQDLPNQCNLRSKQCQIGTVFTATIAEKNPRGSQQQCQYVQGTQFNKCQKYVQQKISEGAYAMSINRSGRQPQGLQQCCNELQSVEKECHCEAMHELARQVRQQMSQQGDFSKIYFPLMGQCDLEVVGCLIPSAMF